MSGSLKNAFIDLRKTNKLGHSSVIQKKNEFNNISIKCLLLKDE